MLPIDHNYESDFRGLRGTVDTLSTSNNRVELSSNEYYLENPSQRLTIASRHPRKPPSLVSKIIYNTLRRYTFTGSF